MTELYVRNERLIALCGSLLVELLLIKVIVTPSHTGGVVYILFEKEYASV